MREAALTCARPVSSGRQNELEADAELFLKPILPQMNQRLFEILLHIEQLHTGISLGLSAPEEPPPPPCGVTMHPQSHPKELFKS